MATSLLNVKIKKILYNIANVEAGFTFAVCPEELKVYKEQNYMSRCFQNELTFRRQQ